MRLRWITILATLALKVALIGAVLFLGERVVDRQYTALELEHVQGDLDHLCGVLQARMHEFDLIAHDYASWDETYRYMARPNRHYAEAELSSSVLRARRVHFYMLVDRHNKAVLVQTYVKNSDATLAADRAQLLRLVKNRQDSSQPVAGLVNLTSGVTMVAMRPIRKSQETGPARGTLVLVGDLQPDQVGEISRLSQLPIEMSGEIGESSTVNESNIVRHTELAAIPLDRAWISASTNIIDLWQRPSIRMGIKHDRSIYRHGEQTVRQLLTVLVLIGLLFGYLHVWLMQRLVVRRVERLIHLTEETEGEAGLSARVVVAGSDELAQLGRHMNDMLERLQNSQGRLLAAQERLRYEASHDPLTGLWNRGVAMQLLDRELNRGDRDGRTVGVIMLDADHFKRINDHFGHSTGDHALQAIAAAITRNLRNSDVCCRYGGEEFMVIAPNCSLEQAEQLAQRIVDSVRVTPVMVADHSFCVTLSAGVTASVEEVTAEDVIVVADRALYRAKDRGRNRVEVNAIPLDSNIRTSWLVSERAFG